MKITASQIWSIISTTAIISWGAYTVFIKNEIDKQDLKEVIQEQNKQIVNEFKEVKQNIKIIKDWQIKGFQNDSVMGAWIDLLSKKYAKNVKDYDSINQSLKEIHKIINNQYYPIILYDNEKKNLNQYRDELARIH